MKNGQRIHSSKAPKWVHISGEGLGYPEVAVRVENAKVVRHVERMTADKDAAKACFTGAWRSTRDLDVHELARVRDERWDNLCDDIVLFAAAKYVLFGTEIPIAVEGVNVLAKAK